MNKDGKKSNSGFGQNWQLNVHRFEGSYNRFYEEYAVRIMYVALYRTYIDDENYVVRS